MRRFQRAITLFWIALGIFVSAYSFRLGLGALVKPGPGLFPFCLGVSISLIALYKLAREFPSERKKDGPTDKQQVPSNARLHIGKLVVLTVILLAFALLLEPLGYILTTFLGMTSLLRTTGYRRWNLIILYAAIISGVTYFGFTYLGTMFPPGILSYLGLY